ncbi:MAG: ATP-binding protein [Ferruginibacter sp.]
MANIESSLNEADRITELQSYDILDSLTEQEYEEITKLASVICDVPIALISFVDKDRQWFKSHLGLHGEETLREYSFCAHAIKNGTQPFIIEDSRLDNRTKDNPLVTGDPKIVFYAGIPLVNENGYGLGTVCVIDTKPRILSEKQLASLKILSEQVIRLLHLRKKNIQLNQFIETQVSNRTIEIKEQNLVLEKLNKELQAFTYVSSHDLQEPLRKIRTFISLLLEREKELLSDKGKAYLGKIDKAAVRIRALIEDLLSYTQSDKLDKVYEDISLHEIVRETKIKFRDEIHEKKALLLVNADLKPRVIPAQFRQLLNNLISNSLKFARENLPPVIEINCKLIEGSKFDNDKLEQSKKYYHIRVIDNGIGFEDKYNDKIFEIFQRLNPSATEMGTGIGLPIVKKIVENHKGFISVSSVENVGTKFDIYIPEVIDGI